MMRRSRLFLSVNDATGLGNGRAQPAGQPCRAKWRLVAAGFVIIALSCYSLFGNEPVAPQNSNSFSTDDEGKEPRIVSAKERSVQGTPLGPGSVTSHAVPLSASSNCALLPPAQRKRLEFLHIPKTGGSTIEAIALTQNITWSACHWLLKIVDIRPSPSCPPHPVRPRNMHQKYWVPYWHLPPLFIDDGSFSPYDEPNVQLFAVVRNPYARLLSEWNYQPIVPGKDRNDPQALNSWTKETLTSMVQLPAEVEKGTKRYSFVKSGHLLPQHVFFESGSNHSTIVLRQERLNQDFSCLMNMYGYNLSLPVHRMNPNKGGALTVRDFSNETIGLIQTVYARDFELFNYSLAVEDATHS